MCQVVGTAVAVDDSDSCITDQTSLMQDTHVRATIHDHSMLQSSVAKSVPAKASISEAHGVRHAQLAEMYQNAAELVKEGSTPAVTAFVEDVLRNLESTVIPAIYSEHQADQQLLQSLQALIDLSVAQASTFSAQFATRQVGYDSAGDAHAVCRGEESNLCTVVDECEERLDHAANLLELAEQGVSILQTQLVSDWCGKTPDAIMELPFRNGARPVLQSYMEAERHADTKRQEHHEINLECDIKKQIHTQRRLECGGLQTTLEGTSCSFAASTHTTRVQVHTQWTAAVSNYQMVMATIQLAERDRKIEFETLEKTKCLLVRISTTGDLEVPCDEATAVPPSEVAEQIESCHSLDVNTADLDIQYDVHESPPSMPDVPVYPCSQPFYEAQYIDLAPVNTCGGPVSCSPCHMMSEYATVRDCPSPHVVGASVHMPRQILGYQDTADVRCCSSDGSTCRAPSGDCAAATAKTFAEADLLCAVSGWHLCTESELQTDVCCSTGCGSDVNNIPVWVGQEETVPPVCCQDNTVQCAACRAEMTEAAYCERTPAMGVCAQVDWD